MRKFSLSILLLLLVHAICPPLRAQNYTYQASPKPWTESFGNHRAVLQVNQPTEAVSIDFLWRRPDRDVDKRCFVIVNATT